MYRCGWHLVWARLAIAELPAFPLAKNSTSISVLPCRADAEHVAFLAVPPLNGRVAAAATCGGVVLLAAALAAVYAWHRLRSPVPAVAWAASFCMRPQGGGAAGLEEELTPLKPKKGMVQVTCSHLCAESIDFAL